MSNTKDNKPCERRVYILQQELLEAIRAYQDDRNISSEAEAVRRLLKIALFKDQSTSEFLKRISRNGPPTVSVICDHPGVQKIEIDREEKKAFVFFFGDDEAYEMSISG